MTDRGLFGCDCGCVWVSAESTASSRLARSTRHEFHHRPDKSKGAGEILRNTRPFVSIRQMEKCGCKLKWSHFLHMWASLCDDLLFRGRNLLSCRELTSYPFLALAHTHIAKQAIPVMQTLPPPKRNFPWAELIFSLRSLTYESWMNLLGWNIYQKRLTGPLQQATSLMFFVWFWNYLNKYISGMNLAEKLVDKSQQKLHQYKLKSEEAKLIWLSSCYSKVLECMSWSKTLCAERKFA